MCVTGPQVLTAASLKVRLVLFNERQHFDNKEITVENKRKEEREVQEERHEQRKRSSGMVFSIISA